MSFAFSNIAVLLPLVYLLALLPAALMRERRRAAPLWQPALIAGYAGLALMLASAALALLDWRSNDPLGLVMGLLISLLAVVILRYSRQYLEGEPGQRRYVLAMLTTLAAVATVVTTGNLIVLVGAWIISSLSLHQLLTFYPERQMAVIVAHKKFIASRLAEVCLLSATALLVMAAGSSELQAIAEHIQKLIASQGALPWSMHLAAVLFGLAVILKSAQLPVHGWLIQVMEAPTPVSAMLHAGLVNLGGFVVLRLATLFSEVAAAQILLIVFGAFTAVIAGLVMMTRISIKVRLAWSTCSQMGFMLMECGLGLYELALVHLIAHSLYKAHAFLYAGESVATLRSQTLGKAWVTFPDMGRVGAALVAAGLSVAALYWGWTQLVAGFHVPAVALAIIAIGLAPLLFGRGLSAFGMLAIALLLQAYFLWHALFASVTGPLPVPSALQQLLGGLVVALFAALYGVQAWLRAHPGSTLSHRLYPYAYGGFFLDEHFTRLTFKLWPARTSAMHNSH